MGKGNKKYGLGKRGGDEFETLLPSGEVCLQRGISIEDMLDMGIMDEIDSLSGIVQVEHIDRVAGKTSAQQAAATLRALDPTTEDGRKALFGLLKDEDRWTKLLAFVNKVVVRSVIEPVVYDSKAGDVTKTLNTVAGSVDVHDVDLQDKLVIMNAAMSKIQSGVVAAEPFREERADDVADVRDGEGVRDASVGAAGGDEPASG